MTSFTHVKQGDTVTRMLAGKIPMRMRVTRVDETLIHCGDWTFDRITGAEVDDDLGWGPMYGKTGSFLQPAAQQTRPRSGDTAGD